MAEKETLPLQHQDRQPGLETDDTPYRSPSSSVQ